MSPTTPGDGPTQRRTTLKDVARDTGYHVTTVSLALRDHASIPAATRQRIADAAARLGYCSNPVGHALSRFRQQGSVRAPAPRIAYLENFGAGAGIVRSITRQQMLDGARRQAGLLGYEIDVLAVGEDDLDARAVSRYLRANHITGVVLGCFEPGRADVALNWDEFAVAKIHSRHIEPSTTVIANDQLREVRLAFGRLRALGYQRIGLAVGRIDEDVYGYRHTAAYLIETAGIPPEQRVPPLLFPYNCDDAAVGRMIVRWVRRHRIDVVLCNWYCISGNLEGEGLRVPADIACACLCLCESSPPTLAGIRPNLQLLGERAVSVIVTQLKSDQTGIPENASSIYVESEWQDGPSAPPRA